MSLNDSPWQLVIRGMLAGLIGGIVFGFAMSVPEVSAVVGKFVRLSSLDLTLALSLTLGAAIGGVFGLVFGRLISSPGSGLMWGVTYGLLLWLIGPLTLLPLISGEGSIWSVAVARQWFPLLFPHVIAFGAVPGLAYPLVSAVLTGKWRWDRVRVLSLSLVRAVVIGGIAGLVGGLAFGRWMAHVGFYPLVAGLVGSDNQDVGRLLHLLISIIIGGTFGALFRGEIRSAGSGVAWGFAYAFIWWMLGPLTIMPLRLGQGVQWSLDASKSAFPSLVGHLIYGILLGAAFSIIDRLWRLFFTESDPLHREVEGPGVRNLRALGMGLLGSIAGGLAFTVVMIKTGALTRVAGLIGMSSTSGGFIVHMLISAVIGGTYGLLYRRDAYTYGAGVSWGLLYGLMWWFLGRLTLMPILLGADVQWSLEAALSAYPSLVGHLAYGTATALAYQLLARRYDPGMQDSERRRWTRPRRTAGSPAPALWVFVLGIVLILLEIHAG